MNNEDLEMIPDEKIKQITKDIMSNHNDLDEEMITPEQQMIDRIEALEKKVAEQETTIELLAMRLSKKTSLRY